MSCVSEEMITQLVMKTERSVKIIKIGTSFGVTIPKFLVTQKKWSKVNITEGFENKPFLVVSPIKKSRKKQKKVKKIRKKNGGNHNILRTVRGYAITLPKVLFDKGVWTVGEIVKTRFLPDINTLAIYKEVD